jgi:uncharacterized membrane protein
MRRGKQAGMCLITLGVGVLLALVLPVGVLIFLSGVALIVLGITWIKG